MFIGQLPTNNLHKLPIATFGLALDKPISASNDGKNWRQCRSVFCPANSPRQFNYGDARVMFVSFEPHNIYRQHVLANMQLQDGLHYKYQFEAEAIEICEEIRLNQLSAQSAYALLGKALKFDIAAENKLPKKLDERVLSIIHYLHNQPTEDLSVASLASHINLSKSHFTHLFTRETGIQISRYRTLCRIRCVAKFLAKGYTLTEAAIESGFSDSAHFNNAYRKIFGIKKPAMVTKLSAGVRYVVDSACDDA